MCTSECVCVALFTVLYCGFDAWYIKYYTCPALPSPPLPSTPQERYWPGEGGGEYGGTSIELLSSEKLDSGIIVRELQLECAEVNTIV